MSGKIAALVRSLLDEVPPPFPRAAFEAALLGARAAPAAGGEVRLAHAGRPLVRARRHGTLVLYDPEPEGGEEKPRRLCSFSPTGELLERLWWDEEEGVPLREARLLAPQGGWIQILPGRGNHPLWGTCDLIAASEFFEGPWTRLTEMEGVRYERIGAIPPAAEPARLSGGAGSVLLNFLASLLEDQDARGVRYRGPYPTHQLFDSLFESFALAGEEDPARAREEFTRGALEAAFSGRSVEPAVAFRPRPFELLPLGGHASVLLHELPLRAFLHGASYSRPGALPPGALCGSLRLRPWGEGPERWALGAEFLGEPLEIHGLVDLDQIRSEQFPRPPEPPPGGPSPAADPLWKSSLALLLLSRAAAPLRPALSEVLAAVPAVWSAVPRRLAAFDGARIVLRSGLSAAFEKRAEGLSRSDRVQRALQAVSELATELAPALLGAAQKRLLEAGAAGRERLLSAEAQVLESRRMDELAALLPALCLLIADGRGLG